MKKLLAPLALAVGLTTLTGCELYFGGEGDNGDDRWTYCASDGYYDCYGDDCEWVGPRCPSEPGWDCSTNDDCAAGCYCSNDGVCEEAGFCGDDDDCAEGYHCDIDRSSCVPDSCTTSADCDQGEYCDENGGCVASCTCDTDAQAQSQGYGYCDEARNTCEPPAAGGSCGGTSTCNVAEPTCPAGSVALILDGCYTGGCSTINTCDVYPTCEALQHEADCLGRGSECASVYYGINCRKPDNSACMAGDQNCTCESFQFADCRTVGEGSSPLMVFESPNGSLVDVFSR